MSKMIGKFITFEGGEGVGKSTNIKFVSTWLKEQGIGVVETREPGGTPIAETIRENLLKAHHDEQMHPLTEMLLVFAARAQHLEAVIKPALARGDWVLCDRFTDSTIAYQGYGRALPLDQIETLRSLAQGDLNPDTTLLLDAPLDVGMGRAAARGQEQGEATDRFESEAFAFFERVRQGFLTLASQEARIKTIDASLPLSQVQADIIQSLEPLLERNT